MKKSINTQVPPLIICTKFSDDSQYKYIQVDKLIVFYVYFDDNRDNKQSRCRVNYYCLTCLKTFIQKKSISQKNSNFEASMHCYEYSIAPMTKTT